MSQIIVLIIILFSQNSFAQTNKSSAFEFGALTGSILPSNIVGVTEIIPITGVRATLPLGAFRTEFSGISGRAANIVYHFGMLSIRNTLAIPDLSTFEPFWLTGIDYSIITKNFTSTRKSGGWHFGFGGLFHLGPAIALRSEFNLSIRPGRILMIGLGVQFKLFEGEEAGE